MAHGVGGMICADGGCTVPGDVCKSFCAGADFVMLGGMLVLQKPIRGHYKYAPGEYPKGWQYMFMVGQNTKGVGVTGGGNATIRNRAIEKYGKSMGE